MVRAGEMRHQVVIQQRSTTQDSAGEASTVWTTFAAVRAALERAPGREVWASAQRSGRVPVVFRLRYLADVTPAMRIYFAGKVHNILSAVDVAGRKEELLITAEELVEVAP